MSEFNDCVVFKATYNSLAVKVVNPSHVLSSMLIMDKYELMDVFNFTLKLKKSIKKL
ncbi:hypothetical protein KEJ48_03745 [Candidatus Bathyarchaeota archaeon]|nr:hypothetical protein [Candidatus Bathyarchaeota archaeon]